MTLGPLAGYTYAGISRRVGLQLGDALITQSFGTGGYPGLDRFGRVIDLHYQDDLAATVQCYQYGYDDAGNRLFARVTQVGHENDRSYLYDYDALQRLVFAHLGRLNANNDAIVNDPAVELARQHAWTLDNLGNWTGDESFAGLERADDTNGDGVPEAQLDIAHLVGLANQIEELTVDDGGGPVSVELVHDLAGNLVFDGHYFYQYDGFNRLVQVHEAGGLTAADFDEAGRLAGTPPPEPGPLVLAYYYDGLGRLIAKRARVALGTEYEVLEEYYYDGVRRIQMSAGGQNGPVMGR